MAPSPWAGDRVRSWPMPMRRMLDRPVPAVTALRSTYGSRRNASGWQGLASRADSRPGALLCRGLPPAPRLIGAHVPSCEPQEGRVDAQRLGSLHHVAQNMLTFSNGLRRASTSRHTFWRAYKQIGSVSDPSGIQFAVAISRDLDLDRRYRSTATCWAPSSAEPSRTPLTIEATAAAPNVQPPANS
jgi:hypothetical protein